MRICPYLFGILALLALIPSSAAQSKAKPPQSATFKFVPFGAGLPSSGQWREGFRVADMNGDGHADIVHGSQRKVAGPPVIFLGDGKGSFARWKDAQFPALSYDYGDVEVADFNRDGHMDIALAMHMKGLLVLTGDGKGVFTNASAGLEFDARHTFHSRAIRVADWNGDGLPDLIALSEGPGPGSSREPASRDGVMVYLNGGSKSWRLSDHIFSAGVFSDSLSVGDFDGDGHMDFAIGSSVLGRKDLVNLWRADGVAAPVLVSMPGDNQFVQAVTAADFDHDGKADLAVAYLNLEGEVWYSVLDLFYSRAGGKWERRNVYKEATREGIVAMASGHLRSRGALDLVAVTVRGETLVYLGDGLGGLTKSTASIPVFDGGCRGAHVELADLDGGGLDEIVSSFADEPNAPVCPSGGGITAWKLVADQP